MGHRKRIRLIEDICDLLLQDVQYQDVDKIMEILEETPSILFDTTTVSNDSYAGPIALVRNLARVGSRGCVTALCKKFPWAMMNLDFATADVVYRDIADALCHLIAFDPTICNMSFTNSTLTMHTYLSHYALWCKSYDCFMAIVENFPELLYQEDGCRMTPVHVICEMKIPRLVEFIAKNYPESLSRRNSGGDPAIFSMAVVRKHKYFVKKECEPDACDDVISTERKWTECLAVINEYARDALFAQSDDGNTIAHVLGISKNHGIKKHQCHILKVVAKYCPELLDIKNKDGQVPTLFAFLQGSFQLSAHMSKLRPSSLTVPDDENNTCVSRLYGVIFQSLIQCSDVESSVMKTWENYSRQDPWAFSDSDPVLFTHQWKQNILRMKNIDEMSRQEICAQFLRIEGRLAKSANLALLQLGAEEDKEEEDKEKSKLENMKLVHAVLDVISKKTWGLHDGRFEALKSYQLAGRK
jgi:hypothetical protein